MTNFGGEFPFLVGAGILVTLIILSKLARWAKVSCVSLVAHGVILWSLLKISAAAIAYENLLLVTVFVTTCVVTFKVLDWFLRKALGIRLF